MSNDKFDNKALINILIENYLLSGNYTLTVLTFVRDIPKVLGGASDGSEKLQDHRIHQPPLHIGRVVSSLLQTHRESIFIFTRPFSQVTNGSKEEPFIEFLIGTRRNGVSDDTHFTWESMRKSD